LKDGDDKKNNKKVEEKYENQRSDWLILGEIFDIKEALCH
jgi:hypothetical protein